VGLHMRAAAGGVDDDRVHLRPLEDLDGALGEVDGERVLAGVGVERAAARLLARGDYLGAVPREHARGGAILRAEGDLLDAAREHARPRWLLARGGRALVQRRAL